MPGTDRLSNSSFEDASPPQPRQILPDGSELIPTRTIATTAPKPAANPLQFIKVGPCDLYKAAQEQLKKVEEIKKVEKTVKEESEDWQSNLDHWKCSRRKRQEHIIDRVVEVKKLELEEHERNKRRGKTLSEMIQERSEKGVGPRKMSIMTYPDEDPSDLTDLGISLDKSNAEIQENLEIADSEALPDARSSEGSSKVPCPDAEEYTYERAIQGYKSFAEKSVKASLKPRVSPPKPGGRIGEKLQELEQVRLRSNSVSDVDLPKVDIHKRRSLFEVVESAETKSPSAERIAKDLAGASIVKQRLSSLEKQPELPPTPVPRLVDDIGPALKDRLSTLESTKHEPPRRIVNEEVTCVSIKERLSSLENGCKESVVSNFSDEELGHKEIPSPAASDREVSSPLVSQALFNNEVNVLAPSINVEGRTNVLVEGTSELVVGDGSPCDNDIHETAPLLGSACKNETEEDNRSEEISPIVCQTTAESSDVACAENCITELKSLKTDKCQNQSASNSVDHVALQHIDQSNESKLGARTTDEKGPKPCVRARKLTPFLTQPASPSISQKDLLVIGEDKPFGVQELLVIAEDEDEDIHPSLTPRTGAMAQGPETSESGIDMEESSLYTDENIDEVLGEDDYEINGDAHDVPDSASDLHRMRQKPRHTDDASPLPLASHEAVTRFDQPQENTPANLHDTKDVDSNKESESVARLDELIAPVKSDKLGEAEEIHRLRQDLLSSEQSAISGQSSEVIVKSKEPIVNYENSMIVNQVVDLSRSNEVLMFPLSPTSSVEPPKEKPPPPPVDVSDADDNEDIVEAEAPPIPPKASVRRIDSTKRLKKEIRKKRSDFLGIEGVNDDVVLEPEVAPPPDMLALLEEERRLDQQLYRQSLSSDADSMEGTNIFMQNTAIAPGKPLFSGQELYRESICAETDTNHEATESRDSGVELDRTNGEECWNNSPQPQLQPHQHSQIYANITRHAGDSEMVKREAEIIETLEKEENSRYVKSAPDDTVLKEALSEKLKLLEEEKLRLEWVRAEEEGRRMADEERLEAKEILLRQQASLDPTNLPTDSQENLRAERERLEQEQLELIRVRQDLLTQQQHPAAHGPMGTNLRYSMPNLQDSPPPPQTPRQFSSWSRIPSADNLLDHPPRHPQQIQQQQMTRTTHHALSAAPRSRIVNGEAWIQPKRKADSTKGSYNYRHWLIQEAEHRRITEQQQRTVQSRRSLPAGHSASPRVPSDYSPVHVAPPPSHHHPHGAGVPWPSQHNVVGLPPAPHNHTTPHQPSNKPLPDAIIQTLTQRVQSKTSPKKRVEERPSPSKPGSGDTSYLNGEQERMLSVSGKKKCSHCGDELGRGAAMVIESLRLFYHIDCFKCCVCHTQLGDGLMGTDVRVRNNKLHCHNCYSSDDGVKFSCV